MNETLKSRDAGEAESGAHSREDQHDHDHDHGHDHDAGCCQHGDGAGHGGRRVFSTLKVAALFIWGAVLVYYYASGRVNAYLTGDGVFRIQTLVAGLGLFVLGFFVWFTGRYATGCSHEHDAHGHGEEAGDHDHDHDEDGSVFGRLLMFVVLLAPVSAAAVMSPDAFSAEHRRNQLAAMGDLDATKASLPDKFDIRKQAEGAGAGATAGVPTDEDPASTAAGAPPPAGAANAGGAPATSSGFSIKDLEGLVKRSDEGNFMISLIELFYSSGDVEVREVLRGQPVETVGQVVPDTVNNPNGTRLRAFRMFMQCCAADARPISIPVEFGTEPPAFKEMGWYKLIGTMDFQTESGIMVPILKATELRPEPEPPAGTLF